MKHHSRLRSNLPSPVIRLRRNRRLYVAQKARNSNDDPQPGLSVSGSKIVTSIDSQLNLFELCDRVEIYGAGAKFGTSKKQKAKKKKKKKKRVHRKVGLQYKIELRVRLTDRKVDYRHKDNMDHRLQNTEARKWSVMGIVKLHQALLVESIRTAKRCDDLSLHSHAEIWYWINRLNPEDPFSFIRCCEYSNVDPDVMRPMLKRLLSHNMPHIDLLLQSIQAAEAGDADAIQWCLSDAEGPLTFTDTCNAAGFTAAKARTELRLPVNTVHQAANDASIAA